MLTQFHAIANKKRVGKLSIYIYEMEYSCLHLPTDTRLHQYIDKSTHSSTQNNNVCANENKHVAKWKNTKIIKCNLLSKIVPGWFYTQAYNNMVYICIAYTYICEYILKLRIQCFI